MSVKRQQGSGDQKDLFDQVLQAPPRLGATGEGGTEPGANAEPQSLAAWEQQRALTADRVASCWKPPSTVSTLGGVGGGRREASSYPIGRSPPRLVSNRTNANSIPRDRGAELSSRQASFMRLVSQ